MGKASELALTPHEVVAFAALTTAKKMWAKALTSLASVWVRVVHGTAATAAEAMGGIFEVVCFYESHYCWFFVVEWSCDRSQTVRKSSKNDPVNFFEEKGES